MTRNLVQRLRYLSSPQAESMDDYERLNQFVRAGMEAAASLDKPSLADLLTVSEAQVERQRKLLEDLVQCYEIDSYRDWVENIKNIVFDAKAELKWPYSQKE